VPALAAKAIESGLDLLSRRAYNELSRLLHISTAQATKLASFISENLNPFPARAHWGEYYKGADHVATYQEPDVIIAQLSEEENAPLIVEVVSPYAGSLRVNPLFRQADQPGTRREG